MRNLIRSWWLFHLRGLMALSFGAFVMYLAGTMEGVFTTSVAMIGVLLTFGLYVFASGFVSMAAAIKAYSEPHRFWSLTIHASLLLIFGGWILFFRSVTVLWLYWFTVATAFISGVLEIAVGRSLHRHTDSSLLEVAGGMSLSTAILLVLARNFPLSLLIEALGIYAAYYGIVLILLSLRLRDIGLSRHFRPEGESCHQSRSFSLREGDSLRADKSMPPHM